MSAPIAPGRVLPTLNADGTRRRIRPRLYPGPRHSQRRLVAWGLMVLFLGLPWLQINHKPLVLLDVPRREFTLFGRTFLPTDGVLLMLLLLVIFVAIIWTTALVGRAWCGWACPQTVYMEFLFRPIERLFEGRREDQLRLDRTGGGVRRLAKNVVFLAVSFVLANIFLSYFVGVRTLLGWAKLSPLEHWTPFVVVAATTGLVFFDFAFFREQMCTVACPYARIQSVLLDKSSLIVGYDKLRGEPRRKGKPQPGRGDCIDCGACVAACPTGIDIRDGLQLECIACAQCADACDVIMLKVKKPLGLIRYGSQKTLETQKKTRILRPRVVIYPVLLAALLAALFAFGAVRHDADVTVLRGVGAPFTLDRDEVTGELRIKVQNRSGHDEQYRLSLVGAPQVKLVAPENPLAVAAGAQRTTAVFAVAARSEFSAGRREILVRVSDSQGQNVDVPYRLLGPTEENKP
jgi:cytochrome c oxidase accessory protein FixG